MSGNDITGTIITQQHPRKLPIKNAVGFCTKNCSFSRIFIVEHILYLVERGFPPRLSAVADMANSLRAERGLGHVGLNWPSTFVKRQPELIVKFNRKYDYKRALCEDSGVVQGWFSLVANIKAKYGIQDDDTYNFDEAGFMMGQISTGAVVTASERRGRPKAV